MPLVEYLFQAQVGMSTISVRPFQWGHQGSKSLSELLRGEQKGNVRGGIWIEVHLPIFWKSLCRTSILLFLFFFFSF